MRTMKGKLHFFLPFLVVFLLWEYAASQGFWSSYILPAPARVWGTLLHMLDNGELFRHIRISLQRILWGFSWALLASCLLSSLNLLFPRLRNCYSGLLEVFRHVPPLSLIPLLILWFGIGELPKTIIIVLASFFPIYLNMDSAAATGNCWRWARCWAFPPGNLCGRFVCLRLCPRSSPGSGSVWVTASGPSSERK